MYRSEKPAQYNKFRASAKPLTNDPTAFSCETKLSFPRHFTHDLTRRGCNGRTSGNRPCECSEKWALQEANRLPPEVDVTHTVHAGPMQIKQTQPHDCSSHTPQGGRPRKKQAQHRIFVPSEKIWLRENAFQIQAQIQLCNDDPRIVREDVLDRILSLAGNKLGGQPGKFADVWPSLPLKMQVQNTYQA